MESSRVKERRKRRDRISAASSRNGRAHIFYLPHGVAIPRGDQITDEAGINYLVLGIQKAEPRGRFGISKRNAASVQQGQ